MKLQTSAQRSATASFAQAARTLSTLGWLQIVINPTSLQQISHAQMLRVWKKLPTFTIHLKPNVGTYSIHGAHGMCCSHVTHHPEGG